MEVDPFVDGAHQHGLRTERRIVKSKLPLTVGFGISDRLHSALQLNQHDFDAGGGLAGRPVLYRAVKLSGARRHCKEQRGRE
jgi:hypothetical protein